MTTVQHVVTNGLCISCGACTAVRRGPPVSMRESSRAGMFFPAPPMETSDWGAGPEYEVCPGKGYPIDAMSRALFPDADEYDVDLGRWYRHLAVRTTDEEILAKASSGGIMTGIAAYLLEIGAVQGVIASRQIFGGRGPRVEPYIARSRAELLTSQGSKYCPVPVLEIVKEVYDFDGKLVFIGTPCQIAGLKLLQSQDPELLEKVPFTIGNFCGGFRDLRETDRLIERAGIEPKHVVGFRYRGGGQPGSMRIEDRDGRSAELKYPAYARMTGVTKHKRCRLCVDATGELADFACGDAWIPRFLESGHAWSIVLTRSRAADEILQTMISRKLAIAEALTVAEMKASQRDNLTSKKGRQHMRRKLYAALGIRMPDFGGGYPEKGGGLLLEIRVLLSQTLFSSLEAFRLYPLFAKLIGRYPKGVRVGD